LSAWVLYKAERDIIPNSGLGEAGVSACFFDKVVGGMLEEFSINNTRKLGLKSSGFGVMISRKTDP
jgi:hypothetical protein